MTRALIRRRWRSAVRRTPRPLAAELAGWALVSCRDMRRGS
jgi:hypothetical protein